MGNLYSNLTDKVYSIGRSPNADLVLTGKDANRVSRIHAKLVINKSNKSRPYIIDNLSTNGTFLLRNGVFYKVDKVYLSEGDVFKFADYQITSHEIFNKLELEIKRKPRARRNIKNKRKGSIKEYSNDSINLMFLIGKILDNLKGHPIATMVFAIVLVVTVGVVTVQINN